MCWGVGLLSQTQLACFRQTKCFPIGTPLKNSREEKRQRNKNKQFNKKNSSKKCGGRELLFGSIARGNLRWRKKSSFQVNEWNGQKKREVKWRKRNHFDKKLSYLKKVGFFWPQHFVFWGIFLDFDQNTALTMIQHHSGLMNDMVKIEEKRSRMEGLLTWQKSVFCPQHFAFWEIF